jgi:predicted MFS family arabinose efflux permease
MLVIILAVGVFGIINTEMGIIGILPYIAEQFSVDIVEAGELVCLFALGVAIAGPTMPLLFSGMNRKLVMLLVLAIFLVSNIVSVFTNRFDILLVARIIPAFFHPIYCSMAFSLAAASVEPERAPKAVSKIVVGVSAGMVIGVPISNYLAGTVSLTAAMTFFAVVNGIVFLATVFCVPSMPVQHRLSYGTQISVLKRFAVRASIIAVILMNGAVFGVFNYLAEYLTKVTGLEEGLVSILLFVYGVMNMTGSMLAGELLTRNALRTVWLFMASLLGIYLLLFVGGTFPAVMAVLTILWGILGGINGNVTQYWIARSSPEAPDFANGLFLTSANLGTTFGTMLGGVFISHWGISYLIFAGVIFIMLAGCVVWLQLRKEASLDNDDYWHQPEVMKL